MVTFHLVLTVKMAPEHNHNDESHQPALPLERADLAGGEVCAVESRQARPYGVAS